VGEHSERNPGITFPKESEPALKERRYIQVESLTSRYLKG